MWFRDVMVLIPPDTFVSKSGATHAWEMPISRYNHEAVVSTPQL